MVHWQVLVAASGMLFCIDEQLTGTTSCKTKQRCVRVHQFVLQPVGGN
jgi:hypothetical protein